MKRTILFDTETTGLDPLKGDRVIEIAALELVGDLPTGRNFHVLIDPERDVPEEASRVHGFTRADLEGKPKFAEVASGFLEFVGDDPLIAHNARFDFGFLNAELARAGQPVLDMGRMVDTLDMARERFPGMPNSLDALCRRFSIDLSERTTHNALLDCRLLAAVYLELTGGRQRGLSLAVEDGGGGIATYDYVRPAGHAVVRVTPDAAEIAAHETFVARLSSPLWND
ncbi:DNA polymerase III subunit epsilon [Komagataeibacter rhaeticus]|uniref:DNA polymerase III subunit epsilon n=1 Tax=Komagataeibacter rhaeticus TaxID=215221 RepID=A0A858JMD2_9PROT|nr:DNA polymerase III subunit epsilon [Komagataeibacter rhaeticus]ATU74229.1 DNA polymerase III subunit epsilon [Komagataeibacter xylinus]EGG75268.1 DNA polymerase III subunit epsilon [Gluconacetobacter sp. SXCC-1]KDU97206.1 DNA polymerase III subunit epsilon [Komagataeibacter rhaeticus AF1]MBL7239633.1 DNA polymerase III subunit epsilon [Komagataeibacter rhaeticus]PYD53556.1 DNA polymerase III subunit epsilon [Komagataeibacter rhaeticus]